MAQSNTATDNPWLIEPSRRRGLRVASWLMQHALWLVLFALAIIIGTLLWQNRADFATGSSQVTVDRSNIYVSDNAHLLSADTKNKVKKDNQTFAKLKSKPQLLIVTVDRLPEGETIEAFTNRLANKLGVGDADADSGVVYLLAKREHQARLEVGYGMESIIPDGYTDIITDSKVKNFYRKGNYDAGINLVVSRISRLVRTGDLDDTDADGTFVYSWRGTWVWLTGTVIGQLLVVISLCVLTFYCFKVICAGRKLQGKLLVDTLWRHYAQDMQASSAHIALADALAKTPSAALKAARQPIWQQRHDEEIAHPEGRLARRPDYADMNFAFGSVTPESVVANAESLQDKFRISSVYLHHWRSWYANRRWGSALYSMPSSLISDRNRNLIAPNLLSAAQRVAYQVAGFVLIHWVSTVAVLWCFLLYRQTSRFDTLWARLLTTLERALDTVLQLINVLDTPHGILYAFAALVVAVCLWLGSAWWTSIGALLRQRVRLDSMMRHYMGDLRRHGKQLGTDRELAQRLDNHLGGSALTQAKRAVASANNHKNKKRADYADMAFAMGSITNARFLVSGLDSAAIKNSSMVHSHEDDWYRPSGGSGTGGSSGGSSSGDSFGGGSFGGGGGTSSW